MAKRYTHDTYNLINGIVDDTFGPTIVADKLIYATSVDGTSDGITIIGSRPGQPADGDIPDDFYSVFAADNATLLGLLAGFPDGFTVISPATGTAHVLTVAQDGDGEDYVAWEDLDGTTATVPGDHWSGIRAGSSWFTITGGNLEAEPTGANVTVNNAEMDVPFATLAVVGDLDNTAAGDLTLTFEAPALGAYYRTLVWLTNTYGSLGDITFASTNGDVTPVVQALDNNATASYIVTVLPAGIDATIIFTA